MIKTENPEHPAGIFFKKIRCDSTVQIEYLIGKFKLRRENATLTFGLACPLRSSQNPHLGNIIVLVPCL